jgi:hypothetical protein
MLDFNIFLFKHRRKISKAIHNIKSYTHCLNDRAYVLYGYSIFLSREKDMIISYDSRARAKKEIEDLDKEIERLLELDIE